MSVGPLFNPFLPEYRADPAPHLHRLRSEEPVHWSPTLGVWVLTRYEDVSAALRDPRFSVATDRWTNRDRFFAVAGDDGAMDAPGGMLREVVRRWMLHVDPPDHTRLRALVTRAFTPRVVSAMTGAIERVIEELLDAAAPLGRASEADFVRDFAYPLPIRVICDLLDVPAEDYEAVKRWSAEVMYAFSPSLSLRARRSAGETMGEFAAYFRALAERRRAAPGHDLVSALLAAREAGDDRLDEAEMVATCVLLAVAGHASTVQLLAGAMEGLLQHPEELALLREDPALVPDAVEEALRWVTPLQLVFRVAVEPVEIGGRRIEPGQMVFLSLAGANRDPTRFAEPDRFIIRRPDNRHLAFGYGIHYCAGAPLGRLEAKLALEHLLRRYPRWARGTGAPARESSLMLRGLTSLPVVLSSR